ncbi:MAG: hypothetical protein JWR18_3623 [Segetibacter sp.]|jgi:hypothetical protein|nr:hypothetical protein [Segetibacter sp.]
MLAGEFFNSKSTMKDNGKEITNQLNEASTSYAGFVHISEDDKLLRDVLRPDIEKLELFTKMLRRTSTLNKAVISVKPSK